MITNWNDCRAGSIVYFRCGGSAEVVSANYTGGVKKIIFKDCNYFGSMLFLENGSFGNTLDQNPFDIIKISPPEYTLPEKIKHIAFEIQSKIENNSGHNSLQGYLKDFAYAIIEECKK